MVKVYVDVYVDEQKKPKYLYKKKEAGPDRSGVRGGFGSGLPCISQQIRRGGRGVGSDGSFSFSFFYSFDFNLFYCLLIFRLKEK